MTPKKRWPNEAEHARMDAISLSRRINQQLEPILQMLEQNKTVSMMELSVRLARIATSAKDIEIKLTQAGPNEFLE